MDLSKLNLDELRKLNTDVCDELKHRYAVANRQASSTLQVGDSVYFERSKWPFGKVTGKITKINRTTALVKASDEFAWKVSLSLLKAGS